MLEHFFGSKTRLKLLRIFFRAPGKQFYVRELARLAETQLHAVRREIANLERLGVIILVSQEAEAAAAGESERAKYYRIERGSLLFDELRALLLKGELLEEEELMAAIKAKGGRIKLLLLTGTFLQEETPTDLLVVGQLKPLVVARAVAAYEKKTGKSVRYTLMDEKEFRDRREIGDKFLYTVFESKHTMAVNEYGIN